MNESDSVTSMTFRVVGLLVLLYVSIDLGNASVPGIFSFASDQLFVDGVVRVEATAHVVERADRSADPLLRLSSVGASPAPTLVAILCRSPLAFAQHQPPRRVHTTAGRDRADGEPPA